MPVASAIYSRRHSARPLPSLRTQHIRNMESTSSEIGTTFFLSNLHCSSCVSTIRAALSSLSPPPTTIDVSIVTQTVTIRHSINLFPATIKAAIDEAGFDIVATPTETPAKRSSFAHSLSRINPLLAPKRAKHVAQCALCQREREQFGKSPSLNDRRNKFGKEKTPSVPLYSNSSESSSGSFRLAEKPLSLSAPVLQQYSGPYNVSLSVDGMTCASCSNTITRSLSELPGVSNVAVDLLGSSATVTVDVKDRVVTIVQTIEDAGYEAEVISVDPVFVQTKRSEKSDEGPFRLSLSIDGMTCASCSNTITQLTSEIPGVSDVAVNLLGKSATVTISRRDIVAQVIETIQDAGYEPEAIEVVPLYADDNTVLEHGPRDVSLRVDGMSCLHCPAKVMSALEPYQSQFTIVKPLTSHIDPILRISYIPDPPHFTIRTLIDAISATSSPSSKPFMATVHRPPSLETRARQMQQREQRSLLLRFAFSVIVAIPTFIIAIVYMSLVPSRNPTRMWFMQPIWAGNASRAEWALLFLATPVMVYSAGMFHRRSLKEIWALWKRGSRTPVWKRFIRFGSMNLLVSTGVSVAYFSSIVLLALAAAQSPSPSGEGDTTTYFDSVIFLTMFLIAGRYLEAYSKGHTADAISALGKLRPTTALLLTHTSSLLSSNSPTHTLVSSSASSHPDLDVDLEKGTDHDQATTKLGTRLERISADLLEVGDIVRVQNGSSPPSDGTIVSGQDGAFDESSLTGESRLVKKNVADRVFVGTINKGVVVDMRVDAIGGETMLDHVVKVVREGQTRRAPIERIADLITGYFVPVVTLLAIVTWVIWLSLGLSGRLPQDYLDIDVGGWPVWSLEFAIAVFVVACPCGIGLAAPTALLVGSGLAAKYGILVRGGGEAFQEAAQLDLVVFDKTGTLTEGGEPRVTDVEIVTDLLLHSQENARFLNPNTVLGIAAEVESASSHPLATAIRQYCSENHAVPQVGSAFEEIPGKGVKASFDTLHCTAIVGNEALMEQYGCAIDGRVSGILDAWKSEGKSVVLLAILRNSESPENLAETFVIYNAFAVADALRSEAKPVIAKLQDMGIGTWMISGDNEVTAKAVAQMVGIPAANVIAGVLPHEKAEKIQWLQLVGMKRGLPRWRRISGTRRLNGRCIVAMIGDGINDAPALTAADVGVAIGSGSDVALSSASFILVSSNLNGLLTLIDLSRTVFNRVKFNFLWATIYNIIALPIAAGVIYPAGHVRLAPVWASLAMALSSVSVVCSSLLLKLYKEPSVN